MQNASIQLDMTAVQDAIIKSVEKSVTVALNKIIKDKDGGNPYLNKGEAAKFLGVSRNTLEKWIIDEGLPVSVIGGTYRFSKADLLAFMASKKISTK
ncbi:helix-turn-helix domain-containing protein [Limosilactobacillus mucosae]|nr:helix-turn-helix domain-containing protein [Limosilactobacillus mucosae]